MLREWVPAEMPEEEELKTRLEAAREKLAVQQLQMKEKKVPVLVLVEGWGTSGKGSGIGSIIQNIDPRFFKVFDMEKKTEEDARKPFLYRHFAKIPEAGKFVFLDSGWMGELTGGYLQGEFSEKEYAKRIESVQRFERQLTDNGYLVVIFPGRNRKGGSVIWPGKRIRHGGSAAMICGSMSIMTGAGMFSLII